LRLPGSQQSLDNLISRAQDLSVTTLLKAGQQTMRTIKLALAGAHCPHQST